MLLGNEKSKVANRLKRVFPKFRADLSHPRGVNGRLKFSRFASVRPSERPSVRLSVRPSAVRLSVRPSVRIRKLSRRHSLFFE